MLTPFSPDSNDKAFAIALQPDGKIVVAGNSNPDRSGPNFALARYTSGGTLDATFGNGGVVTTGFFRGSSDQANAVVVQPDGKILAAGFSIGGSDCDFALVRYSADGALDTTFGSGGKVVSDFSQFSCDEGNAVALQSDGKIVLVGRPDAGGAFQFALARYNADGTLDSTFGNAGKVLTGFPPSAADMAFAVTLQPDGKIVVAGTSAAADLSCTFRLARYQTDGTLDASFGAASPARGPGTSGRRRMEVSSRWAWSPKRVQRKAAVGCSGRCPQRSNAAMRRDRKDESGGWNGLTFFV